MITIADLMRLFAIWMTFLALMMVTSVGFAQTSSENATAAKPSYLVIVKKINGEKIKGLLTDINRDSLEIANFNNDSVFHLHIFAPDITSIRFRKTGSIKRSALWGLGIGLVTGLGVGAATYDAHPCGQSTCVEQGVDPLTTSTIGAIVGAGTGALIGSRFKEIKLQGDPFKYEETVRFFQQEKKRR